MTEYLSVSQFGNLHNLDVGNIRKLISNGRISAIKIGNQWAIPSNTPKPEDRRIKSGKYKNWRKKRG
ncbi:MAG: DNA-binding protein [Defluviitaleaceae bacterium]|nr:DNA-binding protein [Defluviitaleaceae bacterium]